IAGMLGGEIKLTSTPSESSTFTLYLPTNYVAPRAPRKSVAATEVPAAASTASPNVLASEPVNPPESSQPAADAVEDDSALIQVGDSVLLVVENDTHFARLMVDIGRENNFKVAVATRGSLALQMARKLNPTAITLDINLPDIDGWRVLNRLKDDTATRHIPVQIITTEEERNRGLRMGAMGVLAKPIKTKESLDETFGRLKNFIEPRTRKALVIEEDRQQGDAIISAISGEDVSVDMVASAAEAMQLLKQQPVDLIIAALDLREKKGFDLIEEIKEDPAFSEIPLLVYSRGELSKKDELHLKRLTQTSVLRDVRSPQRLVDDVAMLLHRPIASLSENTRKEIEKLHEPGTVLAEKKVLVVDDDIRNIFAMTSILEPFGMRVVSAETGRAAIEILQTQPDIDSVLMDIMMPDMDGYDTMRAIRKLAKFRSLPIIALTAKAMKGDREKCIEAGASDYISKPVDTEQLLSLLRVWLYR
ncbi:MAG TPA: response regulator, partial [Tepidisphaeraceae bacterium]|nr:response regulator [Tepidisphaeraceae bacterium]